LKTAFYYADRLRASVSTQASYLLKGGRCPFLWLFIFDSRHIRQAARSLQEWDETRKHMSSEEIRVTQEAETLLPRGSSLHEVLAPE
jgi:hypothetical protein